DTITASNYVLTTYASTTYLQISYASSTFPTFAYASSTFLQIASTTPYNITSLPNLDLTEGYLFVGNNANQASATSSLFVSADTGNVGIGTVGPGAKLEIQQGMSSYATAFTSPHLNLGTSNTVDNTGFVGITYDASVTANYGWSSGALRTTNGQSNFVWKYHIASAEGAERMRIDTSGNVGIGTTGVGIGTTGPSELLTVFSATDPTLQIGTGSATSTISGLTTATSTIISGLSVGNNAALVVNQAAAANSLYIAANGNVGIGTATPGSLLELYQNVADAELLRLARNTNAYVTFHSPGGTNAPMAVKATSNGGGDTVVAMQIYTVSGSVGDVNFGSGDMYIDVSLGKIGISTTTPRYKLDVWGDMAIGTSTGTNVPALYVDSGEGGRVGIGTTTLAGLLTVGTTTPALVVASNGNVGIGTASPSGALDVFSFQACVPGDIDNGDGTCTATFYPDVDPETTSVDGFVQRSGADESWSTLRNNAVGSYGYPSSAAGEIQWIQSNTTANNWRGLKRSYFLFDTSGLPDDAVINGATLSIYGESKVDEGTAIAPSTNIYSGNPDSNTEPSLEQRLLAIQ
ncbi:MAG: hypothetical protein UU41_C0055G0001, partial [Candidatus Roizmanbacteria bacterium GW2011_GWA1_41_13]